MELSPNQAAEPEDSAVRAPMAPLPILTHTLTTALGPGLAATRAALRGGRSGLRRCDFADAPLNTFIGRVEGLEESPLPSEWANFDCRNHRLARLGLEQDDFAVTVARVRERFGARRIGVVVGTSTSGILETERAYRQRDPQTGSLPASFNYRRTHNTFAVADFVRQYLGLAGPALAVSTACSSSAKAFANAARWLRLGVCDAVVVGGVDSLCGTTLFGFSALDLVSDEPCRPADADRKGISIGEAAGFALLARADGAYPTPLALLGYGESADAYHMSSPHPDGFGAALAMRQALLRAGLAADDIGYTMLHGTATRTNDAAEDRAIVSVLGGNAPCSSTKGWTGHTLGAAGIVNAILSLICLTDGFAPPSLHTRVKDPDLGGRILLDELHTDLPTVMSNAFGFGGNNASLVLGRTT